MEAAAPAVAVAMIATPASIESMRRCMSDKAAFVAGGWKTVAGRDGDMEGRDLGGGGVRSLPVMLGLEDRP